MLSPPPPFKNEKQIPEPTAVHANTPSNSNIWLANYPCCMIQAYFDVGYPYDEQGAPWNRALLYQKDPTLAKVKLWKYLQNQN